MGLISLICPSCGSQLENLDNSRDFFYCPYCGTKTTFDRTISDGPNEETLLERAENYISDGDYNKAKEYFNRVLDTNPRSGAAYMGLVRCSQRAKTLDELEENRMVDFSENPDYRRALEYSVGNDHLLFAKVNSPDHLYRVGMYKLGTEFEENKAALEKKQSDLVSTMRNRVSSLESSLAYDRNRVQTDKQNVARKKSRYTVAVLKSLFFPFFLVFVLFILAVFVLPYAISNWGQYAFIGGGLLIIILVIMVLVRLVKAFTKNQYLYPSSDMSYLKQNEQQMARHEAELAQTKQTLAQCEVSNRNEMQRLIADSNAAKEKFCKEFSAKHPGYKMPD